MARLTMLQVYLKNIHAEQYGQVFYLEKVHSYRSHALIKVKSGYDFECLSGCGPINSGEFAAIVFFFQKFDGMIYCRDCVSKTMDHWQQCLRNNPK